MREIIFRGKRKDNNEWIYGGIVHQTDWYGATVDDYYIIDGTCTIDNDIGESYEVNPDTIGQFTGLHDKNDLHEIYEGDIIDTNGERVGIYHENTEILANGTNILIEKMGTSKWRDCEQEAIKRGCKYAE